MTNQQHPITPPPELVEQWHSNSPFDRGLILATKAAQWGADQELEACCAEVSYWASNGVANEVRAARRPKPPSLKEQAYAALDTYIYGNPDHGDKQSTYNTIRRALEQLND